MEVINCDYCHDKYLDIEEHKKSHQKLHKKWLKAEQELGYLPKGYEEQEKAKQGVYPIMYNKNSTFEEKLEAAMTLIRAHFDCSLILAIERNYWQKHPKFDEYVAMMDYMGVIPKVIWKYICDKYGQKQGEIAPGFTNWHPLESEEREHQFCSFNLYQK